MMLRIGFFAILWFFVACSGSKPTQTAPATASSNASAATASRANEMKAYKDVITAKAVSDEGLFKVHEVDGAWFFEIPNALLGKEMLLQSRVSKVPQNTNAWYGGEETNSQVVKWEKNGKQIWLRAVGYNIVAPDSLPIYQAVQNSNLAPVIRSFEIKSLAKDSQGVVIDVSSMFKTDVNSIGIRKTQREEYQVKRVDEGRSAVLGIRSYPKNIEVRHLLTYEATKPPMDESIGAFSVEMAQSFLMLPEVPMQPRLLDRRVGYFSYTQTNYGSEAQRAEKQTFISRWRLEPKDPEAYKRGELVEPVKPIVYYIDPATPLKWRPFLKQGVNDWQKAFEAAGFKNAIYALDPPSPEEDPEFSPEDARYSVIRYFASDVQNAYGPHVADPRTGEILESDIGWYHNVMNLLRNWFLIQTAAVNPDARKVEFDDALMGELIRFVSAHEVGHTLGLPHNMGSSSAYPVEYYRTKATCEGGTAPSIMDYARFNYIAQPGDDVCLFPAIGAYDIHAINWGYRWIPDAHSPQAERSTLNEWIRKNEQNPVYRFGKQGGFDPSSQTEDLGDDAMKASEYGIANLKRIIPELMNWVNKPATDFEQLEEVYGQVGVQFMRYMGHVTNNVGGVYENYKTADQNSVVYSFVPLEKQKRAVSFINAQLFTTPTWLVRPEMLRRFEGTGIVNRMTNYQAGVLRSLLHYGRLGRMIEGEVIGENAYLMSDYFNDLRGGIWTEVLSNGTSDTYRRNLQRTHLDILDGLLNTEPTAPATPEAAKFLGIAINIKTSDVRLYVRSELEQLKTALRQNKSTDALMKAHVQDCIARIEKILDPD